MSILTSVFVQIDVAGNKTTSIFKKMMLFYYQQHQFLLKTDVIDKA